MHSLSVRRIAMLLGLLLITSSASAQNAPKGPPVKGEAEDSSDGPRG